MIFTKPNNPKNIIIAGLSGIWLGSMALGGMARAVEVGDGSHQFEHPPALENISSSSHTTGSWHDTHFFTIRLPEDAGEPLARVDIELQGPEMSPEMSWEYQTDDTESFLGTQDNPGDSVDLASVSHNLDEGMVSVVFDTPVSPGETVTLALSPDRNPRMPGPYNFNVTAYADENGQTGQVIGCDRLRLYD
ncbi:MAG: DUF2808 domain-containing protein [Sodalinema sp.]|uniref:DUF2808 domain-containing protein n=1 Tax=Sodalinema sp. TaxID=3080550 RepID=UPI00122334A7|nr:MAG: DUF2808 domain-containing protein [Phormidium sp. SL48-SHIP]